MFLEEKVEYMQAICMEDARAHSNDLVDSYRNALEKIFNNHKEDALSLYRTQINAETINAKQKLNQISAKNRLEIKRAENKYTQKLKDNVFKEVRTLVWDFMKTKEYETLLVKRIENAIQFAAGNDIQIYINKSDTHLQSSLEAKTGVTLQFSEDDFIGGIRVVIPKRNILIDNSFETQLWDEYNNFIFSGGNGVA
ncbi:MAG: V-type ATP synthase subunit E [Schaedlerella sp.]|nr:V-type ATP synthase subunit E [Schaedlerella sp.]